MPYTPDATIAVNAIKNRLAGDTSFANIVTGGIYTRKITRESTPTAFDDTYKRLLISAFLNDTGESFADILKSYIYTTSVWVYIVCPADEERKDLMRQAKSRAKLLLLYDNPDAMAASVDPAPWKFTNEYGKQMFPAQSPIVDFGVHDNEDIPTSVLSSFRVTYIGSRI